jgi:hypothetical protein
LQKALEKSKAAKMATFQRYGIGRLGRFATTLVAVNCCTFKLINLLIFGPELRKPRADGRRDGG